jgi:hypothetical protein
MANILLKLKPLFKWNFNDRNVEWNLLRVLIFFSRGVSTHFRIRYSAYGASRSHWLNTPHSAGSSRWVISPTQRPTPGYTQQSQEINLPTPGEFEPTFPPNELPQKHALDRVATGSAKGKTTPLQAYCWPKSLQEFEAPRFLDSGHTKVVRLSAIPIGRLYPPGNILGTHFC